MCSVVVAWRRVAPSPSPATCAAKTLASPVSPFTFRSVFTSGYRPRSWYGTDVARGIAAAFSASWATLLCTFDGCVWRYHRVASFLQLPENIRTIAADGPSLPIPTKEEYPTRAELQAYVVVDH